MLIKLNMIAIVYYILDDKIDLRKKEWLVKGWIELY